jgi:hypothetical protein
MQLGDSSNWIRRRRKLCAVEQFFFEKGVIPSAAEARPVRRAGSR